MGTVAAVEANVEKLEALARSAAAGGARIVVFPEAALTGYCSQALLHVWHLPGRPRYPRFAGISPEAVALTPEAPAVRRLVALAAELRLYLTIPFVERAERAERPTGTQPIGTQPTGTQPTATQPGVAPESAETTEAGNENEADVVYYNSVVLASPTGEVVAHYRKTHLWPLVDHSWATAGNAPAVVDTEFGRLGLGVCYDIHRLGELYDGTNLWALLYSVAWVAALPGTEEGSTEAWFREHLPTTYLGKKGLQCFVVAANWSTDREYKWDGAGFSSVYDEKGRRLAFVDGSIGDSVLFADLPYGEVESRPIPQH